MQNKDVLYMAGTYNVIISFSIPNMHVANKQPFTKQWAFIWKARTGSSSTILSGTLIKKTQRFRFRSGLLV